MSIYVFFPLKINYFYIKPEVRACRLKSRLHSLMLMNTIYLSLTNFRMNTIYLSLTNFKVLIHHMISEKNYHNFIVIYYKEGKKIDNRYLCYLMFIFFV